jgi:hypothetical protein
MISMAMVLVLLSPKAAFAWGPVTHIALGVQVLATVITPGRPLQAALAAMPEVFLYGSLAPDIVMGRRFQSRLRRHSHNWSTGFNLLESAAGMNERGFAYGYLAHLAADVVAHNFFLPSRFVGHFNERASHIYNEACFDTLCDAEYSELLLKLLDLDFSSLDAALDRAIDSPLIPFAAHRRLFEGGLKRIRGWHQVIRVTGGKDRIDRDEAEPFSAASRFAIAGLFDDPKIAPCCGFDPMGARALKNALDVQRNLQRMARLGPDAEKSARELAAAMLADVLARLRQPPFGPTTAS